MDFMINIICYTKIEECCDLPVAIPMYVYNLTKFSDLPTLIGETKYFVDVMGRITHVTELDTRHYQNQAAPSIRRGITLKDENNYEAKIVLWGERALEFDIHHAANTLIGETKYLVKKVLLLLSLLVCLLKTLKVSFL